MSKNCGFFGKSIFLGLCQIRLFILYVCRQRGGRGQKCSNGCHLLKMAQIAHLYRKNLSTKFIIFIILFWILILMEKNLSEKCHSNVVWFEDERSHLQEKWEFDGIIDCLDLFGKDFDKIGKNHVTRRPREIDWKRWCYGFFDLALLHWSTTWG